jgi:hypothetical protein
MFTGILTGYLLALTKLSRGYAYVTSSPLGCGTAPVLE